MSTNVTWHCESYSQLKGHIMFFYLAKIQADSSMAYM
jgi:hypothetical protein